MSRPAPPRGPLRPLDRDRPAPLPGWSLGGVHGADAGRSAGRVPPFDLVRAGRRLGTGAAADDRVQHDKQARFSPDSRSLAFISDRRLAVEEMPGAPDDREDGDQIHILSLDGGEARRLTDLPRGVAGFSWSPDGKRLAVLSASRGATREEDRRKRGKGRQARPERAAPIRLPLRRPALLPVQRRRVHRRQGERSCGSWTRATGPPGD